MCVGDGLITGDGIACGSGRSGVAGTDVIYDAGHFFAAVHLILEDGLFGTRTGGRGEGREITGAELGGGLWGLVRGLVTSPFTLPEPLSSLPSPTFSAPTVASFVT